MSTSVFIDRDFDKLMFNVRSVPEGKSLLVAFPELAKHKEFKAKFDRLDKNKVIRYIMYMYDRNTPLRKKYPDILKRKVEAAVEAKFKVSKGMFDEDVEKMLRGENKTVNKMIVAYVRIHKNFKYSFFVTIEESFYSLMTDVVGGNLKQIAHLKRLQKEIEESMNELLSDDENPDLKKSLLRYVEDERISLRPESIARKIKNNETPATNPEVS